MRVVYATEEAPGVISKSIFLAGPSPRDSSHPNWRIDALKLLKVAGFDGVVFVPLPRDGLWSHSYDSQVEWETAHLQMADIVLFWVPRNLETLPAFTTNVEWGKWFDSGKAILGYPKDAPKMRYLDYDARDEHVSVHHSLEATVSETVDRLGEGAVRTGGEREIPLHIWNLPHFKSWYEAQKGAGNRLDGARLLWSFRVGPAKDFTFAFALHVDVFITSEGRHKTNEFIISRPDIATIVAYKRGATIAETNVALIREFRSPARTTDGFIREVPGGSSLKSDTDPFETMAHELEEETGLLIADEGRIRHIGTRQLNGTLSAHVAHTFAIELTEDELQFLQEQERTNAVHGVLEDTERTYVEVRQLNEIVLDDTGTVDWSMLGMILSALYEDM